MTPLVIAGLIVAGFIFLVIELFLLPGFSVPGLMGIAMIGYGVFKAGTVYGKTGMMVSVLGSALAAGLLITAFLKSRSMKKIGLEYDERGTRAVNDHSALIGREGVALSTLRPSGTALIDGTRYNVVTEGEYIEKDTRIRVSHTEGPRIVVTPVAEETGEE